jgi:methyl-accepting chemotaxis protein
MFTDSDGYFSKSSLLRSIGFMAASAVFISAAIIYFFNTIFLDSGLAEFGNGLETAALTLLPYMMSAVVAAITAIGIIAIWPTLRAVNPSEKILSRIRELSEGDLTSTIKVTSSHQLDSIATELNEAVGHLRKQVNELKLINRAQWSVLCRIRAAAEVNNVSDVLKAVETMEKNWEKVASIEAELTT